MKYVLIQNNEIVQIFDEAPAGFTDTCILARCSDIPRVDRSKGEYLSIENLQKNTEVYEEIIKETVFDEETEEDKVVSNTVRKSREYYSCELVVKVSDKLADKVMLEKLQKWYDNDYIKYFYELLRAERTGSKIIMTDKLFGLTYSSLDELFAQTSKVLADITMLQERGA